MRNKENKGWVDGMLDMSYFTFYRRCREAEEGEKE